MISALENMGDWLSNINILDNKITHINLKKDRSYLCIIDFCTDKKNINITFKEINKNNTAEVAKDYLWIGNLKGNIPQWQATTDNIYYAFMAIPNLLQNKYGDKENLKESLKKVIDSYYNEYGIISCTCHINIMGTNFNTNLYNVEIVNNSNDKSKNGLNKNVLTFFSIKPSKSRSEKNELNKNVIDLLIKETNSLNNYFNNICIYTISIDNNVLVKNNEYRNILIKSLAPEENNYFIGICSVCGEHKKVTNDTTKFKFKYYNTDKISFSSNLSDFSKNFTICSDCYQKIIRAENFIDDNLKSYLGSWNIYIIPENIQLKNEYEPEKIFKITNSVISDSAKSIVTLEGMNENLYTIDIMFYKAKNNFFKIIDIISEIPESRILKMAKNLYSVHSKFQNLFEFSENLDLNLNLQEFYKSMVVSSVSKKEALSIILDLFRYKKIDREKIIKIYLKNIANNYFKLGKIYTQFILKMNAFLNFLDIYGVTSGFRGQNDYDGGENTMKIDEFIDSMGYSKEQEALFWIGYAIKKIGNIQFANGVKSNPILEKINYQGMNFDSLERLLIQIDEKRKQYLINTKEMNYALYNSHSVLSKYSMSPSKWPVSDVSNVFLIMTGYSVASQFGREDVEIKEVEKDGEQ